MIMVSTRQVKRIALAICKLGKLNTSFHHYIKTENPDSIIKNGQALQLVTKAFGYKTYKGFIDEVEKGTVSTDSLVLFNNAPNKLVDWCDAVKEVAKLESDIAAVTLSGMVYFLLETVFDEQSSWAKFDYVELLNAISIEPVWTNSKSEIIISDARSRILANDVHAVNDKYDVNKFEKMLYTANYCFFEALFRCGVYNTIKMHEYAITMHLKNGTLGKHDPIVFSKIPKEAVSDENLIFTLNTLVGDFLTAEKELNVNTVSELVAIPHHQSNLYRDSKFKLELLNSETAEKMMPVKYGRFTQYLNNAKFESLSTAHSEMLARYLGKNGVSLHDYEELLLLFLDSTWLNPYLSLMQKTQEFSFVFDVNGRGLTHTDGMQAHLYSRMLKHLVPVLDDLTQGFNFENLEESIYIDNFGMLIIHPTLVKNDKFTIFDTSLPKEHGGFVVSALELSIIANIVIIQRILNDSRDSHLQAHKWLYLGVLLQFQCYYFGVLKSGVSTQVFMHFASVLGVPKPKTAAA